VPAPAPAGNVLGRLKQARAALDMKDHAGALAIYEEVLAAAGDRADVLVTISGDLGVTGNTLDIIQLIAPRYDAQRHGPATGFNLLQAYIALHDPEAAQHVLDLLFALNRPELQERLLGFSNVIADMMLLQEEGMAAPPATEAPANGPAAAAMPKIDLVSISKPIWQYGLEEVADLLPPKEGKLRKVAFGQLAVLGLKDYEATFKAPEEEMGRLSRGIPLWLGETLFFSQLYSPVAAIATWQRERYGLFKAEWTPDNIRQLADTVEGGLDYVFTGSLRQQNADYEMVLRLWEVKKFRERKAMTVRWNPATADHELAQFHAQLRGFMEWKPYPAGQGLTHSPLDHPRAYVEALGSGLSLFLFEKKVLPGDQIAVPESVVANLGAIAGESPQASLLALGMSARAARLGLAPVPPPAVLATVPAVDEARRVLGL